jgi:hypothetical protein
MVAVARDITGGSVLDVTGSVAETVPDGLALAILIPGAFDLVGRRRSAPEEALGEPDRGGRCGERHTGALGDGYGAQRQSGVQQTAAIHCQAPGMGPLSASGTSGSQRRSLKPRVR